MKETYEYVVCSSKAWFINGNSGSWCSPAFASHSHYWSSNTSTLTLCASQFFGSIWHVICLPKGNSNPCQLWWRSDGSLNWIGFSPGLLCDCFNLHDGRGKGFSISITGIVFFRNYTHPFLPLTAVRKNRLLFCLLHFQKLRFENPTQEISPSRGALLVPLPLIATLLFFFYPVFIPLGDDPSSIRSYVCINQVLTSL